MPNRVIREDACTSQSLAKVSLLAEGFWLKLLTQIDDFGRFDARAEVLRGRMYPLRPRVTARMVQGWLAELAEVGTVRFYAVGGIPYGKVPSWDRHNRMRAQKPRYPDPPPDSGNGEHLLSDDNGGQHKKTSGALTRARAPDSDSDSDSDSDFERDARRPRNVDEVLEFWKTGDEGAPLQGDPVLFFEHFTDKGWHWKSWKRAAKGWSRREPTFGHAAKVRRPVEIDVGRGAPGPELTPEQIEKARKVRLTERPRGWPHAEEV